MKKKSTSQPAPARRSLGEGGFLNLRVLFGLFVMLAGVFLALLGFGTFSSVFAQNNNNGGITRQQMTLTLAQAAGVFQPPACVPGQEMFTDVPASNPFCPWIEEMVRRGVTSGCTATQYCPGSPVTRAQMAAFVVRATAGAAVAGANVAPNGIVRSWFNRFGGEPTVNHSSTGRYDITFPGLEGQVAFGNAIALVSLNQNGAQPGEISRSSSGGNAIVFTFNSSGGLTNSSFEIVVFVPGAL